MSTKPETIEVFVTTCDRPRCGRECGRSPAASKKKQPDFFLKRPGKPDIVYDDLCYVCINATDNYCDGIEKVVKEKPVQAETGTGEGGEEPVDPPEPDPPVGGDA